MEPPPPAEATAAAVGGEWYGSLTEADVMPASKRKPLSTGRRQVDSISLLQSLVVPWLLFVIACALLTFRVRLAGLWVALLFLIVWRLLYLAYDCWRCRHQRSGYAAWLVAVFFLTTVTAGLIAGIVVGRQNSAMLEPYDTMANMGIYFDVNPDAPGIGYQLVDAGRIFFLPGTRLDVSKSEGFKSGSVYCVAPVTSGKLRPGATVDFWAVGVDCCSGTTADYQCGNYNNPNVYAGMRLLDDGQRGYFRLAVQQAEAAYKIRSPHPVFLHWTRDPIADMNVYPEEARKRFCVAVFVVLAVQFFLTCILAALLSKFHLRA